MLNSRHPETAKQGCEDDTFGRSQQKKLDIETTISGIKYTVQHEEVERSPADFTASVF